jgi:hypothetical protein
MATINRCEGVDGKEALAEEQRRALNRVQDQLRVQIELWGGAGVLDAWLRENDPGHTLSSRIKEMDWSWLEQKAGESF